jgi:hypothetical protein
MKALLISSVMTVAALLACGPANGDGEPDRDVGSRLPERAQTRQDTLMIEGMPEPTTSRLLRSPVDFAVPFSTYVPEGLESSFDDGGAGSGVRFTAAFAGVNEPNAYMHVRLYVPGEVPDAMEVTSSFLRTRQPQDHPVDGEAVEEPYRIVDPPTWGTSAFEFQYPGEGGALYMGRIVIGVVRDRQFHVLTHYPAEYGDGLGPRFQRILEDWRWDDTGEMLTGNAAATAPASPGGVQ